MVQQKPPLVQLFIQKPWQTNTVLYNHVGVISPYGVNRPLIITLRCPSPRPALIFLTEKMTFSSDRQTDESTLAPLCGCHRDDERVWRGRWGMGGWRMGGLHLVMHGPHEGLGSRRQLHRLVSALLLWSLMVLRFYCPCIQKLSSHFPVEKRLQKEKDLYFLLPGRLGSGLVPIFGEIVCTYVVLFCFLFWWLLRGHGTTGFVARFQQRRKTIIITIMACTKMIYQLPFLMNPT